MIVQSQPIASVSLSHLVKCITIHHPRMYLLWVLSLGATADSLSTAGAILKV